MKRSTMIALYPGLKFLSNDNQMLPFCLFVSCWTESAVALEKTFLGRGYVFPFSKFSSTEALKNNGSTDLVGGMWPACCQHIASMLPACCQHVASMLPACCQHVASMLPVCCQLVTSMLQACCWCDASKLPACCQHVTSMLPACYQHVASMLP